jgi:outer membrane lipoprotein SlyB
MKRWLGASAGLLLLCGGCVTTQPWTPTVDTYGSSRNQYVSRDLEECRRLARGASGSAPGEAVRGAAIGGLVGAAGGAAIGAALGNPGRGAALGAAAGGIGLGASRAAQSDAAFRRAYSNCMRQRGHNVLN